MVRRSSGHLAPLAEVLAYRNAELITRFCTTWDVRRADALGIFDDLKRYLWLCVRSGKQLTPVPIIDEMWHAFLMYTIEYREFSTRYFGEFYDHVPTPMRVNAALKRLHRRAPKRSVREFRKRLMNEIPVVQEAFGDRVMLRWYVRYAVDYDARFFIRRRLPSPYVPSFEYPPELLRAAGVSKRRTGRRATIAA